MRLTLTSLSAALMVLLFAAPAFAQDDAERAQKHFDAGAEFYIEGEYGKALVQLKKAYSIIENPVFLFNIALTEHKLGNTERARDAADEALKTGKLDVGPSTVAQALSAGSTLTLRGRRVATLIQRNTAVAQNDTGEGDTESGVGDTSGDVTADTTDSSGFGALGWTGVGLTALGAGALVGSGIIGMSLNDDYAIYEDETAAYADRVQAKEDLESGRPLGVATLIGGSLLVATGVTLIIIELTSDDGSGTTVSLGPTPDGGSVWLEGRF